MFFFYGSWVYLLFNIFLFLVLMVMILFFYFRVVFLVLFIIYFGMGVIMWFFVDFESMLFVFGCINYYIGVSGVVYGMVSFLVFMGFFCCNVWVIVIFLVIVFYYGGMIWGVLLMQEGVFWEGYLFGVLVGIFVVYWFCKCIEEVEECKIFSYEFEQQEEQFFLLCDVFNC